MQQDILYDSVVQTESFNERHEESQDRPLANEPNIRKSFPESWIFDQILNNKYDSKQFKI